MNCFSYKGRDRDGKTLCGTLWGESEEEIKLKLHRQGLLILHLALVEEKKSLFRRKEKRWKEKDVVHFAFQMALMLKAGISLKQIMHIMGQEKKNSIPGKELEASISRGESLYFVLKDTGFPSLGCTLVQAGEVSGLLGDTFEDIHHYYERNQKWKSKLYQALTYPAFVVVLMIVFFLGAVLFILPTFTTIFDALGTELPFMTKLLLAISSFIKEKGFLLVALFIGIGWAIFLLYRKTSLKQHVHRWLWKAFHDRVWYGFYFYGRLCRVVGLLLKSGIPLMRALTLALPLWGNEYAKILQKEVMIRLENGGGLGKSFQEENLGTPLFIEMLRLGELSGNVDEILLECAQYYELQVEAYMNGIQQVIEPLLLSVVGVFVGLLVLAIMLPLFETISAVSNF